MHARAGRCSSLLRSGTRLLAGASATTRRTVHLVVLASAAVTVGLLHLARTSSSRPTTNHPIASAASLPWPQQRCSMSSSSSSSSAPAPAHASLPPLASLERHSPLVVRILGLNPGPMTLQGTNTYLIGTGVHRLLVDTGEGREDYAELLKGVLEKEGVRQLTILLSHWHHDHTGGIRSVSSLVSSRPRIYKHSGANFLPVQVVKENPHLEQEIRAIEDDQRFSVPGATLRALYTPGHTHDHCCFLLEEEQAILSGDTVLGGGGTAVFTDLHDYLHSLKRIHHLRPGRLYPAHGPIIDGEEAPTRVEQYIQHRAAREEQIVQAMDQWRKEQEKEKQEEGQGRAGGAEGQTAMELVELIYKGLPTDLHLAAANNVLLHLGKLQKDGRVHADELPLPAPAPAPAPAADSTTVDVDQEEEIEPEPEHASGDECHMEVAKAMAIARQRARWQWRLI